jgi:phenylacetate-coenzyme A ligase PaaK-like adenylate-forming protein
MSERVAGLLIDAHRARTRGPGAIRQRQRARLAAIVAHARAHSPYYRALYKDLPDRIEDAARLPVTNKQHLTKHFDECVTDREVTLEKVHAFTANPDLLGERLLGAYTPLATSGTTGTPAIFVQDDRAMAVANVLLARMLAAWLAPVDVVRIMAGRGHTTLVCATGGHYAEAVAGAILSRRWGNAIQVLDAKASLTEIVDQLNRFCPVVLAPYASVGALLARAQEAHQLHITPQLVALFAEGLPEGGYERIANVFNAKVRYSYGATEFPFIAYSCVHGWLHVNGDWVVLEPVDADFRPTPPGDASHTVLLSNLANRVQPILRYDLGDRIVQRPDRCPCGNLLDAIRVEGRTADVLTFAAERGQQVAIPALMFEVVDAPGVERFQIVQTTPTSLRVRIQPAAGADPDQVWRAVRSEVGQVLAARSLGHVAVARAEEPPEQSPGGKFRAVIPFT